MFFSLKAYLQVRGIALGLTVYRCRTCGTTVVGSNFWDETRLSNTKVMYLVSTKN